MRGLGMGKVKGGGLRETNLGEKNMKVKRTESQKDRRRS